MSDFLPDPPRWKECTDQANLAEREAGRAIRFMRAPEPLPVAQLTRIAAGVRAARPQRRYFWLTVTAAVLLCGATVASAAHLNVLPGWLTRIVKPRPAEPAARKHASLGPARSMPATGKAVVPMPPAVTSQPDQPSPVSDLASRKSVRKAAEMVPVEHLPIAQVPVRSAELEPPSSPSLARAPAASSASSPPRSTQVALLEGSNRAAETSSAQDAAKYLSEAIRALRVEHSPGMALFLLDRHATELGKSAFVHEALLLRVEAMLALGRRVEVLRLLDGLALTDVAASRSLLVTRGELRAAANRCADGLGDFDLVLAKSKQADRQALFGRALCRKKLGDSAGARADIERYRREFPTDPRLPDFARE